jgi:hypothetical protein
MNDFDYEQDKLHSFTEEEEIRRIKYGTGIKFGTGYKYGQIERRDISGSFEFQQEKLKRF